MAVKTKKRKEEKNQKTNKTQVEKEDFDIKGNKCCERRRREVSDGSDLIGGWPPLPLDSLVCVFGKNGGKHSL